MWDILHHVCKCDTADLLLCCSAILWMNTRFRFLSNSFTVTWNPKLKSKGPSLLHWLETTSAGSFHINSLFFVAFVLFISFKKLCRGNIMCHILCRGIFFCFFFITESQSCFIYLFIFILEQQSQSAVEETPYHTQLLWHTVIFHFVLCFAEISLFIKGQ